MFKTEKFHKTEICKIIQDLQRKYINTYTFFNIIKNAIKYFISIIDKMTDFDSERIY